MIDTLVILHLTVFGKFFECVRTNLYYRIAQRSPSHGASHGRTDLQAIPPCKPPPSRPPITPASIDDSSGGTTGANSNSANSNNANNNNNNNSCVGTPTNNASVLATPTARQSKSVS